MKPPLDSLPRLMRAVGRHHNNKKLMLGKAAVTNLPKEKTQDYLWLHIHF
uniref:Uncharacterized protein n=1 Tax=Anguilla anguilla TaxID=7936 RepID=A0A0E9PR51_ANGAN